MDTARVEPPDGARRSPSALTLVLACLLTALFVLSLVAASNPDGRWWKEGSDRIHPALPADAARAPLATPAAAPGGTGGYQILEREDDGSGRPVRWDPCRPIHYVIRPDGAPAGGQAAVQRSVALVEQITGLRFTYDGTTEEPPQVDRPTEDVARYGNRWSPVLVAWTDPHEYPEMSGYAGLGGPEAVSGSTPGHRRYVTGVVLLNRDHLDQVVGWDDGQDRLEAVILHEFGHLVGLDHVADPNQLMFRQPTVHPGFYAAGDRRGLAALADGPCYRDF